MADINFYQKQIDNAEKCEIVELQEWDELTNFDGSNWRLKIPTELQINAQANLDITTAAIDTLASNISTNWPFAQQSVANSIASKQ